MLIASTRPLITRRFILIVSTHGCTQLKYCLRANLSEFNRFNNNNNNASVFILRRLHTDTMYESPPPCEQRRITFNDDGQRVQLARPELPAQHHISMYRLLPTTPPSPFRHYYPRFIAGTNLPTPKGLITWLAKADCTYTTFAQLHN